MIVSNIRKTAEGRGIENGNQLKDALKISPTLASRLWRGEFSQIGMVTLDRLCRELNCQPGQLLQYVPSRTKRKICSRVSAIQLLTCSRPKQLLTEHLPHANPGWVGRHS